MTSLTVMAAPLSKEHGGGLSSGNNSVLVGPLLTPEVAHCGYSSVQHGCRCLTLHSAVETLDILQVDIQHGLIRANVLVLSSVGI